jgi:hypothetical protein
MFTTIDPSHVPNIVDDGVHSFAECSCGWRGKIRSSFLGAVSDNDRHAEEVAKSHRIVRLTTQVFVTIVVDTEEGTIHCEVPTVMQSDALEWADIAQVGDDGEAFSLRQDMIVGDEHVATMAEEQAVTAAWKMVEDETRPIPMVLVGEDA